MKALTSIISVLALVMAFTLFVSDDAAAQTRGHGYNVRGFVDNDGDGFNDLAPDADGDGIPNGQDPDYVRPQDGTGNQFGGRESLVNDGNSFRNWYGQMHRWFYGNPGEGRGNGWGPGDGTGNGGNGPGDGTGNGPGTGDCDGTGPHGPGRP